MVEADEFSGLIPVDDRLPLVFLRERRRELVLALQNTGGRISRRRLEDIAAVQQAIKAIETVISE